MKYVKKTTKIRNLFDLFTPKQEIPIRIYFVTAVTPFFIFLAIWFLLSLGGYITPLFLPSPTGVIIAVINLIKSGDLFSYMIVSIYRVTLGFIVAAAIAVPLGILMGSFRIVQALIEPLNDFIRYMPVAAFIPLAILWTGIGDLEKIVIIFIGTFFQLILMVADNARVVPTEFLEVAYTLGGSKWAAIRKVLVPAALPGIFDSLRIAMGWAWSYLIVAEIVSANRGLGFLIIQSQRFLQTDKIMAGIIIIGMIGLVTDYFFRYLSHKLFPWTEQEKA